jgi:hypothetical protein
MVFRHAAMISGCSVWFMLKMCHPPSLGYAVEAELLTHRRCLVDEDNAPTNIKLGSVCGFILGAERKSGLYERHPPAI